MSQGDSPRLAILGAGPIGLEAATYARRLNLPVTVYESGRVGEHLHRWGHVRLFSPFGMNVTSLGRAAILADHPQHRFPQDTDFLSAREHVASYLDPLARSTLLANCVRGGLRVVQIGRQGCLKEDAPGRPQRAKHPFRLLLRTEQGKEELAEAEIILDCTGTYGQHRWAGEGGIPACGETAAESHIAYGLEDVLGERRQHYAGKSILVLGAGYSAATTICNLARLAEDHPETWIIWLTRGSGTQPIKRVVGDPLKERDRLAVRANTLAARGEGNVEFHSQSALQAVERLGDNRGFLVTARCGGKPHTWEVDRIIANVGSTPDTSLYRELQVHECYASLGPMNLAAALLQHAGGDCLSIPPQGANSLKNPEPNFFLLGAKSYGRNSNFLLRNGFEQVREVFTLITGKPDLNLYGGR